MISFLSHTIKGTVWDKVSRTVCGKTFVRICESVAGVPYSDKHVLKLSYPAICADILTHLRYSNTFTGKMVDYIEEFMDKRNTDTI